MNRASITTKLRSLIAASRDLVELDLAGCRLLPQQLEAIGESLLVDYAAVKLRYLNLSYINVSGEDTKPVYIYCPATKHIENFINYLCQYV